MPVRDVAVAGPRTDDEQDAALRVHVVRLSPRIVLCYEDRHVPPIGRMAEKSDYAAERQVVIRHPGSEVGIASVRLGLGAVVVADRDVRERGHLLLA